MWTNFAYDSSVFDLRNSCKFIHYCVRSVCELFFLLSPRIVFYFPLSSESVWRKYTKTQRIYFVQTLTPKHHNIYRNLENIGRKFFSKLVVVCDEIRSFTWKSGCGWRSCEQLVNYEGIIHTKFFTQNRSFKTKLKRIDVEWCSENM